SRTGSLDAQWQPLRAFAVQAGLAQTGALPNNSPRVRTQRYDVRWQPAGALQVTAVYTKSNQTGALTSLLQGQESFAGRAGMALGRSILMSGGLALTDPGSPR